ncbi:hypothetical protein Emag_003473 [Eimeria magna]
MVAILIPQDYLHQTIALIARRTDTQVSCLHMQFTEAYDAYRDLCARFRSPPHLGEHSVVTAFLGNLPKDIARDTHNQASAADRLNDLQYVARLAINFDTLARTYPGRGEHRPQDANLQLHPGKCSFGEAAVRYLGHIVSCDGIKPCPSKVQAILEMPVPKTAKAVQRFLGKCSAPEGLHVDACRRHRLARIVHGSQQLRRLRRRPGSRLFTTLRRRRARRGMAYASRSLLDHERKRTATELEAIALIWALETFRHYIDTIEVCIRTDHAPLEYIRHNSSQCRRLERWALRVQEFRFKVIHRPGAQHKHVDCLSRAPVPPTPTQVPIVLDEFSSRTVLHARAKHPAPVAPSLLWCAPLCAAANHVANSALRRMRLLRHRLRHMCAAVRAAGSPGPSAPSGSDDDADVQVCLTDSEEDSPTPPTAQLPDNAPPKVIHGGRNIPLPPAVEHLCLKDAQAQDPECQEFLRLARTPRAAWPPHLRHTPLQFCVLRQRRASPAGIGGHTCSGMFASTSGAALSASLTPTPPGNGSGSTYP